MSSIFLAPRAYTFNPGYTGCRIETKTGTQYRELNPDLAPDPTEITLIKDLLYEAGIDSRVIDRDSIKILGFSFKYFNPEESLLKCEDRRKCTPEAIESLKITYEVPFWGSDTVKLSLRFYKQSQVELGWYLWQRTPKYWEESLRTEAVSQNLFEES